MKRYLATSYVNAARSLLASGHDPKDVAQSIIRQLTRRKSLKLLPQVVDGLSQLKDTSDAPRVVVTTAQPLTDASRVTMQSLVTSKYGANARVTERIQKEYLGGFSLQNEDDVTDFSVSTLLSNLKSFIQNTPV